MQPEKKIYKLHGKVLHYAWGGFDFLPSFLGVPNPEHQPFAEYWMGVHPLAPAEVDTPEGRLGLEYLISRDPAAALSRRVVERFGELPYLFKVQDVREILSIQVHPDKAEAEKGFDREEAAGIPRNAPHRNYKDRNHKPEMLVALSEFWLLHGFRKKEAIEELLETIPEFNVLMPLFRREGLQGLYEFVMAMEQPEVNTLLTGLVKREIRMKNEGRLTKEMPGWWIAKLYQSRETLRDIDRAAFSIYFFNIVKLNAGEGLFQGAGIPHAYLEGHNIELMANSDNVLRAGLTPKHIDVPELIRHTKFDDVAPEILQGEPGPGGETLYPCDVDDFGLARVDISSGMTYSGEASSLEMMIVTAGGAVINNSLALKTGEAVVVLAGGAYHVETSGHCTLFRAFVPDRSSQAGEN